MDDEDFVRRYEAFENETAEDFLRRYSSTEVELRDTIAYLIRHRELIRDVELKLLEAEAQKLLEQLRGTNLKKLLAEIECFKDILVLHRRLIEKDGKP